MRLFLPLCLALACVSLTTPQTGGEEPIAAPAASPSDEPGNRDLELKPILAVGVEIAPPSGKLPRDFGAERLGPGTPAGLVLHRTWPVMTYYWKAPASVHHPLYFEEVNAERYGYVHCHCLQPVVSAAHFFGRIPALPYLMAAQCPRECVYTLGHYRPGNCNPWRKVWPPCLIDGAACDACTPVGFIANLP